MSVKGLAGQLCVSKTESMLLGEIALNPHAAQKAKLSSASIQFPWHPMWWPNLCQEIV
jgi:hypothetical protein